MGRYIARRAIHGVIVLFGVSIIVFLLMHLSGDPVAVLLPLDTPPEQIEAFRQEMGFDRPLPVQYFYFMSRAVRGDFGYSYHYRTDAMQIVLDRMPATLKLAFAALFVALIVSIPAGIFAALRQGRISDMLIRILVLFGQAVPGFWLALMLIIVFGVRLKWLPVSGAEGWKSLILPAIVTGSFSMATITRLLRCNLLETFGENYIVTARGKGLPERLITTRHALKNAAIPAITVIGLQMGWLLGGAVISEVVFAYPGMGRLAVTAIGYRDVPVIQAFVTVTAIIVVVINLSVDIMYSWLDPRIRLHD
ncbi:MAG: ABC transporter permease [Anaerolineae bacterium]|jgi:peptide/nickel transport system permease protein